MRSWTLGYVPCLGYLMLIWDDIPRFIWTKEKM